MKYKLIPLLILFGLLAIPHANSLNCTNQICEVDEDWKNCPRDCGCPEGLLLVRNTCRVSGTFRIIYPFFVVFTVLAFIKFSSDKLFAIKFPKIGFEEEVRVDIVFVVIGVVITILVVIVMMAQFFQVL